MASPPGAAAMALSTCLCKSAPDVQGAFQTAALEGGVTVISEAEVAPRVNLAAALCHKSDASATFHLGRNNVAGRHEMTPTR